MAMLMSQESIKNHELNATGVLRYAFIDVEVGVTDKKIHDIGALRHDGATFHSSSKKGLLDFLNKVDFLCGHNIIHHDTKYLFEECPFQWKLVDTLYVSPLLFPERPYHRLVKDYKLISDQVNNPVNDCVLARDLLIDEISVWNALPDRKRKILASLLSGLLEFDGFLCLVGSQSHVVDSAAALIKEEYKGKICQNSNIENLVNEFPCELAYALALIDTDNKRSITPGWVIRNYPRVEYVMRLLRHTSCADVSCDYCSKQLDLHYNLKSFFGFDEFRTFEGENLQERAAQAAVDGKSLLAIFPTGGGKSLTFQLPALMSGNTTRGLTVVISPLQSLMKDQVDNLVEKGVVDAVTINGMLDPISRSLSIQRVQDGDASLLYISPEMLRSNTIERILMSRHVVRFVIDEAHCFSSWGQDFRVDYLYIGEFIRHLQQQKGGAAIPVSCFTATAKQKVIQDISDYFEQTLGLKLELFASTASRTNLKYSVIHTETEQDKYAKLRSLLSEYDCPTIIYVSRTRRSIKLAGKLCRDGYKALPFHGQMEADLKVNNQDLFMRGGVNIIVATSAFGMGVDKKDVGLVVHYDISDSLENYVQEAGRAGRDPQLKANCYVLYGDDDLNKHFILLNQTKLSMNEIQQVWRAVKFLTKNRPKITCSALEIARQAGWDDSVSDIETRVRTALSALERGGYLKRGNNVPHVYATGITVRNMEEARNRLNASILFDEQEKENAVRIVKSLISQKYLSKSEHTESESRVDYIADILGLSKRDVLSAIERMCQEGILADNMDISAFLQEGSTAERKTRAVLDKFAKLEQYILNQIPDGSLRSSFKQLNDNAVRDGIATSKEKDIRTLLYFLTIKGYAHRVKRDGEDSIHFFEISRETDRHSTIARFEKRLEISRFAVEWLYNLAQEQMNEYNQENSVKFSVVKLLNELNKSNVSLFNSSDQFQLDDVEEALLYLSKIGALKLEGGFMVLYNAMEITRIKDSRIQFKKEDYQMLDDFYKHKIQQVHIVGEYANMMVRDYNAALHYVQDYFQMDYKLFIAKYFKGNRKNEIGRNVTPDKYLQLFGNLSQCQLDIINDKDSRCIVVAAGPGSGKTRVLVHKLASLLLLEDVKHEQLLMLTFSRAVATEFKQRLMGLIGNAAHFVEIKTFHSYCFDLLGRIGNLDDSKDVVSRAASLIEAGDVEPSRISKTVLVIDEAQDMNDEEFKLVKALMTRNDDMRVIAVGDDDQNIFEFRGADSQYLCKLTQEEGSRFIEMTENYRSSKHVVDFTNVFVKAIGQRLKSTLIKSVKLDEGWVEVNHYKSQIIYEPVVNDVLKRGRSGSTAVLTQTNEEAVTLVAMLHKCGVGCKLIQSIEGFRFLNLAEIRFFLKYVGDHIKSPIIQKPLWDEAKNATFEHYAESTALPLVKRCLDLFEQINGSLYLTDFKEYVFESSAEDFCDYSGNEVIVSTIHKAKGHEFDDVFMLLAGDYRLDDALLRRFYVGMTRAKNRLFIYTNGHGFSRLKADRWKLDDKIYSKPDTVVMQLSHKDIDLSDLKWQKSRVLSLMAGCSLLYRDYAIFVPGEVRVLVKLSKAMKHKLQQWESRDYYVAYAKLRFVVAWKPKNAPKNEEERAVPLVEVLLRYVPRVENNSDAGKVKTDE